MADPGTAWSKGAVAYRRMAKGPMAKTHQTFAQDVAAQLKPKADSGRCRVLDVASGFGEPGFSVLEALPAVHLTSTDVAPGMLEQAEIEAQDRGLRGIEFKIANSEDLSAWPDNTFDAVTCSFALFAMNSQKALQEWQRVLKPQGYLAFSTWDFQQHGFMEVMAALIPPPPGGGAPGGVSLDLGKPEPVLARLKELGFENGRCRESNLPLGVPKENLRDLLSNPFCDGWIERSAPEGPQRDEFAQAALQKLLAISREKEFVQDDGSYLSPKQVMLYFTAVKP